MGQVWLGNLFDMNELGGEAMGDNMFGVCVNNGMMFLITKHNLGLSNMLQCRH